MRLSRFVPEAIKERIIRGRPSPLFRDYDEALASIGESYDAADLAAVVVEKTRKLKEAGFGEVDPGQLRILVALSLLGSRTDVRVLDFGGAAGAHYLLAKAFFSPARRLSWCVVETPAMVQQAAVLADERLSFATSVASAVSTLGHVDLVFSSGALQYVPEQMRTLEELIAVRAEAIFLTRWGVLEQGSPFSIVQKSRLSDNGPGPMPAGFPNRTVRYPVSFLVKDSVMAALSRSYDIKLLVREEAKAYETRTGWVPMFGFAGVRRQDM